MEICALKMMKTKKQKSKLKNLPLKTLPFHKDFKIQELYLSHTQLYNLYTIVYNL